MFFCQLNFPRARGSDACGRQQMRHMMDSLRCAVKKSRPFCRAPNPIVVTESSHEPARARVLITIRICEALSLRAEAQPSSYFPSCPLYIYIEVSVRDRVATLREFSLDTFASIARSLHPVGREKQRVYT